MEKIIKTCVMCPMGCQLEIEPDGDTYKISGNTCKRGQVYGLQEMKNPMRVVTSLVMTDCGKPVSVKTSDVVPKDKIFEILNVLAKTKTSKNAIIGDVLIENILELGVDILVTGIVS